MGTKASKLSYNNFECFLYKMWYVANDGTTSRIAYAFSNDGINWTKLDNTVLEPNNDGWETAVSSPFVMKDGNQFKMWFASINNNIPSTPQYSGVERYRIGYATSSNGLSWNRQSKDIGQPGSFDSTYVAHPSILIVNDNLWMYYPGYNGSNWSIGLATTGEIESERNAVVIVPGMFASFDPKAFATCSSTDWQNWKLIPRVTEYNGLIKTLEAAGYTFNIDLFLFPYDW